MSGQWSLETQGCSAELVLSMRLLIGTSCSCAAWAANFETGVVAQSDGAAFHRNTIPQVARLGNGRLMAVMGVYPKATPSTTRIATAISSDGGRTWAAPKVLYEEKEQGEAVGDPNMLVDGNTVFVYWTRVYSPNTIKKAWTWAAKSTDNGETFSQPQEIVIPAAVHSGEAA